MMAPPAVGSPMSCRVGSSVAPWLLCTVGVTVAPPALLLPPHGLCLGRFLWLAWAVVVTRVGEMMKVAVGRFDDEWK